MSETTAETTKTPPDTRCADCREDKLGDRFTLAIEDGSMAMSCTVCGGRPDILDRLDSVYFDMQPIPVSITFEADHPNLGGWHGDVRCDCNYWYAITPLVAAVDSTGEDGQQ